MQSAAPRRPPTWRSILCVPLTAPILAESCPPTICPTAHHSGPSEEWHEMFPRSLDPHSNRCCQYPAAAAAFGLMRSAKCIVLPVTPCRLHLSIPREQNRAPDSDTKASASPRVTPTKQEHSDQAAARQ